MSVAVADYSDNDRQLVAQILFERYGRLVPLQSADVELQLDPASEALTACPALYWEERGAHFVVIKTGDNSLVLRETMKDLEKRLDPRRLAAVGGQAHCLQTDVIAEPGLDRVCRIELEDSLHLVGS